MRQTDIRSASTLNASAQWGWRHNNAIISHHFRLTVTCLRIKIRLIFHTSFHLTIIILSLNNKICGRMTAKIYSLSISIFMAIFPDKPRLASLLKLRMMEVVVTTGAISRAKLQSNRHHQQTNNQLSTGRMRFLSPNQQCQSTEGKNIQPLLRDIIPDCLDEPLNSS